MAKVIIPLIVIAGIIIAVVLAVTQPCTNNSCPSPSPAGTFSTDNGHFDPPGTDVQPDDFPEIVR